jgi:RNA polymerase sigma factor (sigma-70 family)
MTQLALLNDSTALRTFEMELMPHADALLTFAMRYTSDLTKAEDLVQDTYLKAWKSIKNYIPGTNAKAWLFTICKNLFINDYRSNKNQLHKVDFDSVVNFHNEDDPINPSYSDLYEENNHTQLVGDEVAEAINSLKIIYRTVVLLDLQGFTYAEIAAIVDIELNTVRSRLNRGRAELAKSLRAFAITKGYRVTDNGKNKIGGTKSSQ